MFDKGFKIFGKTEKWFLVAVLVLLLFLAYATLHRGTAIPIYLSAYCAVYDCK